MIWKNFNGGCIRGATVARVPNLSKPLLLPLLGNVHREREFYDAKFFLDIFFLLVLLLIV